MRKSKHVVNKFVLEYETVGHRGELNTCLDPSSAALNCVYGGEYAKAVFLKQVLLSEFL